MDCQRHSTSHNFNEHLEKWKPRWWLRLERKSFSYYTWLLCFRFDADIQVRNVFSKVIFFPAQWVGQHVNRGSLKGGAWVTYWNWIKKQKNNVYYLKKS
jgi:hypothetical protein